MTGVQTCALPICTCFNYLQNNKALKQIHTHQHTHICFNYLQNNKALKQSLFRAGYVDRFNYLQNNKALKPAEPEAAEPEVLTTYKTTKLSNVYDKE